MNQEVLKKLRAELAERDAVVSAAIKKLEEICADIQEHCCAATGKKIAVELSVYCERTHATYASGAPKVRPLWILSNGYAELQEAPQAGFTAVIGEAKTCETFEAIAGAIAIGMDPDRFVQFAVVPDVTRIMKHIERFNAVLLKHLLSDNFLINEFLLVSKNNYGHKPRMAPQEELNWLALKAHRRHNKEQKKDDFWRDEEELG